MMLAGELALAGVDAVVVEPRPSQDLDSSRSGGLHSRTIEVLDQRGIADRFLEAGQAMQVQAYGTIPLDISDFPTRHNYGLALWQRYFEPILAAWVEELGVTVMREHMVTGFMQEDTGITVELSDGQSLRAQYLVGCDGGRSVVRRIAGIEFRGWDPTTYWLIAEVETNEEPAFGLRPGGGIGRVEESGLVRVVLTEPGGERSEDPTLEHVRRALIAADGTDYGVHSPAWISRFTDMTRQAVSYRQGRVLLAGDAAHVHAPAGGQGLNIGVQDAVNLGWKLAQVVKGVSPASLLDTYHSERHPVGARVLQNTMAQIALRSTDDRTLALLETMRQLLGMDQPRQYLAGMLSGLDVHYDLGEGHPLLGRRMPDLDLETAEGPRRVFSLLHAALPVLLNLGEPETFDITPWSNRVQYCKATYAGTWELPVLGEVTPPVAMLIRPDGYVAWVGDPSDPHLPDTISSWFGAPTDTPD